MIISPLNNLDLDFKNIILVRKGINSSHVMFRFYSNVICMDILNETYPYLHM